MTGKKTRMRRRQASKRLLLLRSFLSLKKKNTTNHNNIEERKKEEEKMTEGKDQNEKAGKRANPSICYQYAHIFPLTVESHFFLSLLLSTYTFCWLPARASPISSFICIRLSLLFCSSSLLGFGVVAGISSLIISYRVSGSCPRSP